MMKFISAGLWAMMRSLGRGLCRLSCDRPPPAASEAHAQINHFRTEMTGVPILQGGKVTGYVVFQMVIEADVNKMADPRMDPQPYFMDAAFQAIFQLRPRAFPTSGRATSTSSATMWCIANERMGQGVVRDALIEQLRLHPPATKSGRTGSKSGRCRPRPRCRFRAGCCWRRPELRAMAWGSAALAAGWSCGRQGFGTSGCRGGAGRSSKFRRRVGGALKLRLPGWTDFAEVKRNLWQGRRGLRPRPC